MSSCLDFAADTERGNSNELPQTQTSVTIGLIFIARHYCEAVRPFVRLSVCLSVCHTRVLCRNTKYNIKLFTAWKSCHDSSVLTPNVVVKFWLTLTGENSSYVWKIICDFWQILGYISVMIKTMSCVRYYHYCCIGTERLLTGPH